MGSSRPEPTVSAIPDSVGQDYQQNAGKRPTLAIIGAGRVSHSLGRALVASGYTVGALYSRSHVSAQRLADLLGTPVVDTAAQAADRAQLTIIAVSDSQIESVCAELATVDLTDKAVVHTAGAVSVSVLLKARQRRALTGGLHPILPIAEYAPIAAGGIYGVEADREPLRGWLYGIVGALGGQALWLRPNIDRARYHAAAVLTSNYLVTLVSESLGLLSRYTQDEPLAQAALIQLARATLDNIDSIGLPGALTGPMSRGDAGTIAAHLATLTRLDPELAAIYQLLGARTLRLAAARGLEPEKLDTLRKALGNHANDNP